MLEELFALRDAKAHREDSPRWEEWLELMRRWN
jgi:hypothetical protein